MSSFFWQFLINFYFLNMQELIIIQVLSTYFTCTVENKIDRIFKLINIIFFLKIVVVNWVSAALYITLVVVDDNKLIYDNYLTCVNRSDIRGRMLPMGYCSVAMLNNQILNLCIITAAISIIISLSIYW